MITIATRCVTEHHAFGVGEGGVFFQRDVRELKGNLSDYAGKVQMVYLDPPFFTGQQFYMAQRVGAAGWQGKTPLQHLPLYQDKYDDRETYLNMVGAAIDEAMQLLNPTGCIYLHCDYRMSAHLRLLMDEKLGAARFINEIIWHYHTGGRARDAFSRKHDTILLYGVGKTTYFNREAVAIPRGRAPRNHMKRSVDTQGLVSYSIKSNGRVYTYREDDPVYPDDVWEDIPHLQQRDPERTGYDTQKPVALLNRMILASTLPGDRVADLFAGSGTTATAAAALGRTWLAVDQSPISLDCHRRRLSGTSMTLTGAQGQDGHRVRCEMSGGGFTVVGEFGDEVEWFAGGFFEADVFHVVSISGRSQRDPILMDSLSIGWGENPGAMVADAGGKPIFLYIYTGGGSALTDKAFGNMRAYALEKIRNGIFDGHYKLGDRLPEVQLARELGISRTPIREAIRQLETEGLVTTRPNREPVVTGLSLEDVEEIYAIRIRLEGLAARWAARRITQLQAQQMESIVEQMETISNKLSKKPDPALLRESAQLDARFHGLIYQAAGSKPMQQVLDPFLSSIYLSQLAKHEDHKLVIKSIQEHRNVLTALLSGDPELAEQVVAWHAEQIMKLLIAEKAQQSESIPGFVD